MRLLSTCVLALLSTALFVDPIQSVLSVDVPIVIENNSNYCVTPTNLVTPADTLRGGVRAGTPVQPTPVFPAWLPAHTNSSHTLKYIWTGWSYDLNLFDCVSHIPVASYRVSLIGPGDRSRTTAVLGNVVLRNKNPDITAFVAAGGGFDPWELETIISSDAPPSIQQTEGGEVRFYSDAKCSADKVALTFVGESYDNDEVIINKKKYTYRSFVFTVSFGPGMNLGWSKDDRYSLNLYGRPTCQTVPDNGWDYEAPKHKPPVKNAKLLSFQWFPKQTVITPAPPALALVRLNEAAEQDAAEADEDDAAEEEEQEKAPEEEQEEEQEGEQEGQNDEVGWPNSETESATEELQEELHSIKSMLLQLRKRLRGD